MSARSLHGPDGPLEALGVKDMSLIALKHMWWPVALISQLVEADSAYNSMPLERIEYSRLELATHNALFTGRYSMEA